MTDITKQALSPPRSFLSQDAIQLFYRLLAALLICAALAVFSESFLSFGNILNVLRQASLTFFIASGLTLVVLTAGLDLSVGANVALSACLAGTVIHQSGSPTLGILTALLVGGTVGLLNGVMVTALRIPSFIASYGMLWVLNGLTYWYMAGETIHGFPAGFRQIGSGYLFGLPIPVYLLLAFLTATAALLGSVHGDVRVPEKPLGLRSRLPRGHDAHACADPDLGPRDGEVDAEGALHALGDHEGVAVVVHVFAEDDELVAPKACDKVRRSHGTLDATGGCHQQLVARIVAEAVVDPFETVEVHHEDRQRAALPRETCNGRS